MRDSWDLEIPDYLFLSEIITKPSLSNKSLFIKFSSELLNSNALQGMDINQLANILGVLATNHTDFLFAIFSQASKLIMNQSLITTNTNPTTIIKLLISFSKCDIRDEAFFTFCSKCIIDRDLMKNVYSIDLIVELLYAFAGNSMPNPELFDLASKSMEGCCSN
jgi:hypothetical protein